MNDRVPKDRLGTSKFNDVFLEIYPYGSLLAAVLWGVLRDIPKKRLRRRLPVW